MYLHIRHSSLHSSCISQITNWCTISRPYQLQLLTQFPLLYSCSKHIHFNKYLTMQIRQYTMNHNNIVLQVYNSLDIWWNTVPQYSTLIILSSTIVMINISNNIHFIHRVQGLHLFVTSYCSSIPFRCLFTLYTKCQIQLKMCFVSQKAKMFQWLYTDKSLIEKLFRCVKGKNCPHFQIW